MERSDETELERVDVSVLKSERGDKKEEGDWNDRKVQSAANLM
jgi:hypothetical protein